MAGRRAWPYASGRGAWTGSAARLPGVDKGQRIGIAATVATEVLYGCSFVFTKSATDLVDPITLLGWRFLVAAAVLLVLVATRVVRLTITWQTMRPLLVLAALQPVIYYVAETYGVARTTAAESGLIISAIPVAILLAAFALLGRRPSRPQAIGIAISSVGVVATVIAGGLSARFDLLGYLLLLGGVAAYALYVAFAERYAHTTDADRTFVMVLAGAVLFGGWALLRHGLAGTLPLLLRQPLEHPGFGWAVGYLALGPTIGAFFLQNLAIRHLGSTRYSTFIGVSTLTAVATAMLVLGERPGPAQLLGGLVILIGVYVANRPAGAHHLG